MKRTETKSLRPVGIREAARLTNCSPTATVECSNCGQQLRDTQRKHAPAYCTHCGHKLRPLPIRMSFDRIIDALNAFAANNPVNPV